MKTLIKNMSVRFSITALLLISLFLNSASVTAQDDSTEAPSKPSASMTLSYKISDGVKSVKVAVSEKVDGKWKPVDNLIVNLYFIENKKYDPTTGEGWMGNHVTNSEGEAVFTFHKAFYTLTANRHDFKFVASTSNDLRYEDMEEELAFNDFKIDLSFNKEDSLTTAVAKVSKYEEGAEVILPETPMFLLIKRTFSMLPFGEEGLTTDENGEVSGELPADLPGNANGTITVFARFVDEENNGIIEVSKNIPWSVLPHKNRLNERTLWSTGNNAPIPLVAATVSIIVLIWGTICYLVFLLIKIKRLGKVVKK